MNTEIALNLHSVFIHNDLLIKDRYFEKSFPGSDSEESGFTDTLQFWAVNLYIIH